MQAEFPPVWLKERCAVFWQRATVTAQQVWRTAAPASSQGLRVVKDTSKQTFERLRAMPWRNMARRYKVPLWVIGGALLAAALLVIIIEVPQRQAASWRGQPGVDLKELPKLENDARTTLIQGLGGLVLLIGLYLTLRNLQLTQDRQITEHYTRAIEQLGAVDQGGKKKLEVRLGAIYALERIARDSERDHWPIMEILTAYVRENASWNEEQQPSQEGTFLSETWPTQSNQSPPKLPTDIQAILTVLERRLRYYGKGEDNFLDLRHTDLRGADLYQPHLEAAEFDGAHLERATLLAPYLQGADFRGAHLQGAILIHAHLERAVLKRAYLERAVLMGAHLEGADFEGAHLQGAFGLTVEQLATVKTLYGAQLDPPLLEQIQQHYRHLLEEPQN